MSSEKGIICEYISGYRGGGFSGGSLGLSPEFALRLKVQAADFLDGGEALAVRDGASAHAGAVFVPGAAGPKLSPAF
jgi:hypothetical protein